MISHPFDIMKPKSRITNITVARLYNLGNYEHVRFEICAEVPKGGSPKQTLLDISGIAQRLKPIKKPYNYEHMLEVCNKIQDNMSEHEKANFEDYQEKIKEYVALKALQKKALDDLEAIGGTGKRTDAKDTWQDDDDCPW